MHLFFSTLEAMRPQGEAGSSVSAPCTFSHKEKSEKLNFICHTQDSHALLSFLVFVRAWGQSANLPLYKIAKIFDNIQFFHFVMSMSLEA